MIMSMCKSMDADEQGVSRVLDYDFKLVLPAVMALLQRRLEQGLRQTMSVLLGSEVSELAWERAKLPSCFGGLGIRVAQDGICGASNVLVSCRPAQGGNEEHA